MSRARADASVFYAVADPTRRAVLEALRDGERPVRALLERIDASQSALSQHLAVLRHARLVRAVSAGRLRLYSLDPAPLDELVDWVALFDRFWSDRLDRLGRYLSHAPDPSSFTPRHTPHPHE